MFKLLHGAANIICATTAMMFEVLVVADIFYMIKNPIAWSITMFITEVILFVFCTLISVVLVADLLKQKE